MPTVPLDGAQSGGQVADLLRQQALLEATVGQLALAKCGENCRALLVRRHTTHSQLEAVKGLLAEAQRQELTSDRREAERAHALALQDGRREDPVAAGLSAVLGVPTGTINLGIAIFFGWLLEGIACFCWYMTLPKSEHHICAELSEVSQPNSVMVIGAAHAPWPSSGVSREMNRPSANDAWLCEGAATSGPKPATSASGALSSETEGDQEARLCRALAARQTSGSISEIVRLLGCTEGRALALRRQIAVTNPELLVFGQRLAV